MKKAYSLTEGEVKKFRRDGYLGPFDLYESEYIVEKYKTIRAEMFDREHAVFDVPHTSLLAGYDRHLDINFFSQHILKRQILDKLECLLGDDILCWRSEMFPKYPGDEGTDWHQADTFAHASGAPQIEWPMNTGFGGAITVWTAITDSNEDNGCLRFIPGTHEEMFYDESKEMQYDPDAVNKIDKNGMKRGFFGYDYRNLQKDPDYVPDDEAAVSINMKAGQFVMFWSTLMHSSFPNSTTDKTRLGFTARYVPTCVRVYPDTDSLDEYGSVLTLDKYGTVLVSGQDTYGHNKIVTKNMRSQDFVLED